MVVLYCLGSLRQRLASSQAFAELVECLSSADRLRANSREEGRQGGRHKRTRGGVGRDESRTDKRRHTHTRPGPCSSSLEGCGRKEVGVKESYVVVVINGLRLKEAVELEAIGMRVNKVCYEMVQCGGWRNRKKNKRGYSGSLIKSSFCCIEVLSPGVL